MDGAQNRTSLQPFSAIRSSAKRSAMRVLPVPQAMIALARSRRSKQDWIWFMASRWWGRGSKVRAQRVSGSSACRCMRSDQSTLDCAMSEGVSVKDVTPRF